MGLLFFITGFHVSQNSVSSGSMRCTAEILYLQHQLLFVLIISEKKISTELVCHWCACERMQYRKCLVHSHRIYRKCRRNESLQQIGQQLQWEMWLTLQDLQIENNFTLWNVHCSLIVMTPAKKFTYWLRWRVKAFLYFPDRMSLIFVWCVKSTLGELCCSIPAQVTRLCINWHNLLCSLLLINNALLHCLNTCWTVTHWSSVVLLIKAVAEKYMQVRYFLCWKAIYCCTSWQAQESKSASEHKIS